MAKPLVIVESPAKARTISGFLGDDWTVLASYGHIRDLPTKGLNVDVDNHFKVEYEVTADPARLRELKAALKDADELYLATDEDREGEAISWHLLEVLKPKVPVKRMVFHEITRAAIEHAVNESRDIDYGLVDAADSRRIVDRLFGYPVSEVVWRKVKPRLSAGRVQSPAVRLVVEREQERMAFTAADYWGLEAAFPTGPDFTARLHSIDGARVAEGRDFDASGATTREGVQVLDEAGATGLVGRLADSDFAVTSVETRPYSQKPKAPFITSTLQQVGGSRLRLSAQQVMRVAQGLYERGYITYMRTDSTNLSDTALSAARQQIGQLFGKEYVLDGPRSYTKKSKNAQEAHEAIRPAGETFRSPDQLQGELSGTDLALYRLIWQRTLASQMPDAAGQTVSVRLAAKTSSNESTEWAASGRTITFPGFLAVYGFSGDDAAADDDETARLPELREGQALPKPAIEAEGHTTQAPARYTEATLVKRLEELGIGRPSTYASIMQRIQNAGYIWKKGQALVPTTDAFAVINLLTGHFGQLVEYDFTARMEDALDDIAGGREQREPFLHQFWFGNGTPGLKALREAALENADPVQVNTIPLGDSGIAVRNGKYGPYVQRGEETASLPAGIALDEITVAEAERLLALPKGDEPIGADPESGLPVYAKNGRFGPYVQLGDAETLPPKQKPKMASLFQTMSLERITVEEAMTLLSLPRSLGADPADGVEITAQNGRYGPYITKDKDSRSLDNEERIFTVTLDEALALLAQPKKFGRRQAAPPLRDLGNDPDTGKPMVVKEGRFGIYVTDGETNATVPKSILVEQMSPEQGSELLRERRERGPAPAKKAGAKKAAPKKAAPKKKAAATKSVAKKATKKVAATEDVAEEQVAGD
ncbi:MAG: topA [Actinomycetia bacterium]|nr:topA [Actinomycetes bacterium]